MGMYRRVRREVSLDNKCFLARMPMVDNLAFFLTLSRLFVYLKYKIFLKFHFKNFLFCIKGK